MTDVPHLSFPFVMDTRSDGSRVARVEEQDSLDEITQCTAVVLTYPEGSRAEVPDFGLPDQTFKPEVDLETITAYVTTWEPRVDVEEDLDIGEVVQSVVLDLRARTDV